MSSSAVNVLSIVGYTRSGSTVVASLLGQMPGVFSVGEIHALWRPGWIEQELCACGRPMTQCEVWREVFQRAFGGFERVNAPRINELYENNARARHALQPTATLTARQKQDRAEYLGYLERFYGAIQETTRCSIIVDTSKLPSYSFFLGLIPSLACYALHMVRDSRAVAYSWLRTKVWKTTQGDVNRFNNNIGQVSREWNAQNILAEWFGRSLRSRYSLLRYEDFAVAPGESMQQILALIGHPRYDFFTRGNEAEVTTSHILGANPNRFERGPVKINLDDAWKSAMKKRHKIMVTALTLPLLLRYRYRLNGG